MFFCGKFIVSMFILINAIKIILTPTVPVAFSTIHRKTNKFRTKTCQIQPCLRPISLILLSQTFRCRSSEFFTIPI